MFCGNCRNQLPDDARFCNACGASMPPAAVQPTNWDINQQTTPVNPVPQQTQQQGQYYPPGNYQYPPQNWQQGGYPPQGAEVQSVSEILIHLLVEPIEALTELYQSVSNTISYAFGGAYALIWLLCGMMFIQRAGTLVNKLASSISYSYFANVDIASTIGLTIGSQIGKLLLLAIAMVVAKLIYAAVFYIVSDKQRSFQDVFALLCAGSLYESIVLVLLILSLLVFGISGYVQILLLLFVFFTVGVVSHYSCAKVIAGETKAFRLTIAVTAGLVLVVLLYLNSSVSTLLSLYDTVSNWIF